MLFSCAQDLRQKIRNYLKRIFRKAYSKRMVGTNLKIKITLEISRPGRKLSGLVSQGSRIPLRAKELYEVFTTRGKPSTWVTAGDLVERY